jgi:TetR/AcrR family transcriptional regulator, transcriptional repressor for nem operon
MARQLDESGTASRILDVAEELVQTRGFDGFSYAHVAAELGVTSPSLHYHFGSKAELGEALIERYAARFLEALNGIESDGADSLAKLGAYARVYGDVLRRRRMCLCGMLAAGYDTLPDGMRGAVIQFFDENERWLARVLEEGSRDGSVAFAGDARDVAQSIISGLEGAMLVARPYGDAARFDVAARRILDGLVQRR